MKTSISFLILLIAVSGSLFAQKEAMQTITENDLKAHLEFIASDNMQGREFTTPVPGLEITADYLKTQCELMGLKPGGDGFFQTVAMEMKKPDPEHTDLQILNSDGEVVSTRKDFFALFGPGKSDTLEAGVVFAGYGWYDDKTKYNDTEGIDIKDKIVLVMSRNIEACQDTSGDGLSLNLESRKIQKAAMGGARALIIVPDPLNPDKEEFASVRKYSEGGTFVLKGAPQRSFMPLHLILGTEELANELIKNSGKNLAQLQQEINESGKPQSFEVEGISARIYLPQITSEVLGKNVVAVVEGSDPVLKNECIVYTAHYDHLGLGNDGEVYNGADDNGTGTVSLIEIAQAYQSMKKKPRRSIVFAWVTAEEKGLFGSDYYSQHPQFPLDNTLVDINLDMVGRSSETELVNAKPGEKELAGPNGLYVITGKQSSELLQISDKLSKEMNLVLDDSMSKEFLQRSDYYHFYKHGIPVLGFSTGLHEDYHKVTDEVEKIDYTKMKRVAQYAFLLGDKVANQKKRIVVDQPSNK